jgi:hypothetical protein
MQPILPPILNPHNRTPVRGVAAMQDDWTIGPKAKETIRAVVGILSTTRHRLTSKQVQKAREAIATYPYPLFLPH